jgi:hypothetical protein
MFSDAEFQQLLATASPEELEQLMGLGTLDERGALLDGQLAQAQALRTNNSQGHSTGLGAGLGGLSDVLNAYSSVRDQKAVGAEQQALAGKKDAGRNLYVELLRRRGAQPTAEAPTQPTAGLSFGLDPLRFGGV